MLVKRHSIFREEGGPRRFSCLICQQVNTFQSLRSRLRIGHILYIEIEANSQLEAAGRAHAKLDLVLTSRTARAHACAQSMQFTALLRANKHYGTHVMDRAAALHGVRSTNTDIEK